MIVDNGLSKRIISGVPVCCGAPEQWVVAIDDEVARRSVCLGYVNTHTAYLLEQNSAYRSLLQNFILLNDGVGLDIISLIKYGKTFEFNLNGSDFTPLYLQKTRYSFRVFVLGGKPGVAERAANALKEMAPQHEYVGAHRGHLTEPEEKEVATLIKATRANLVIVGFGNPDQEIWMGKYFADVNANLAIGVGALLDFLAGSVPRAPDWMQRSRLEWLHRLALEPRRMWKRYMWFTPKLIFNALTERSVARWLSSILAAVFLLLECDFIEPSYGRLRSVSNCDASVCDVIRRGNRFNLA